MLLIRSTGDGSRDLSAATERHVHHDEHKRHPVEGEVHAGEAGELHGEELRGGNQDDRPDGAAEVAVHSSQRDHEDYLDRQVEAHDGIGIDEQVELRVEGPRCARDHRADDQGAELGAQHADPAPRCRGFIIAHGKHLESLAGVPQSV
jgi:hypothetical protein